MKLFALNYGAPQLCYLAETLGHLSSKPIQMTLLTDSQTTIDSLQSVWPIIDRMNQLWITVGNVLSNQASGFSLQAQKKTWLTLWPNELQTMTVWQESWLLEHCHFLSSFVLLITLKPVYISVLCFLCFKYIVQLFYILFNPASQEGGGGHLCKIPLDLFPDAIIILYILLLRHCSYVRFSFQF